jgi:DNA-binding transcriptional LysR family regulator
MRPAKGPELTHNAGLRALRIFKAVLRIGSVTAAAREVGLTQPAASRLLAQFEEQIGFELFHRDRGRLLPTPDGLLLFEDVERALDSFDRVFDLARDIDEFRVGHLKIVAPPSFLEGILPDVAAAFLKEFPNVHLTMDSHSVEAAKSLIASRAVDAGFVKLPLDRRDLAAETVMRSGTACVLRADHALAASPTITPEQLRGEPLILLGLGRSSRNLVEEAFAQAGVRPRVHVETHTVGSACALVARGVGIAIANSALAASYVREQTIVRPFVPDIVHEYAFVTAAGVQRSRLAEAFLAVCKRIL